MYAQALKTSGKSGWWQTGLHGIPHFAEFFAALPLAGGSLRLGVLRTTAAQKPQEPLALIARSFRPAAPTSHDRQEPRPSGSVRSAVRWTPSLKDRADKPDSKGEPRPSGSVRSAVRWTLRRTPSLAHPMASTGNEELADPAATTRYEAGYNVPSLSLRSPQPADFCR
jgi:hypothetical protein